jgi:hypothetical protein
LGGAFLSVKYSPQEALKMKELHRKHRQARLSSKFRSKGTNNPQGTTSSYRKLEGGTKRPLHSMEEYEEIQEPRFWVYLETQTHEAFEDDKGFYVEIALFGEGFVQQKLYVNREEVYMKS